MHTSANHNDNTYKESLMISSRIQEILSEKSGKYKKIKKLTRLQAVSSTTLARQQIAYYKKKLQKECFEHVKKIIAWLFVLLDLLFTLRFLYCLRHPEKTFYGLVFPTSDSSIVIIIFLIPVCALGYFLLRYIFSQTSLAKYQEIAYHLTGILLIIFTASQLKVFYHEGTAAEEPSANTGETLAEQSVNTEESLAGQSQTEEPASTDAVVASGLQSSEISLEHFTGTWMNKDTQQCQLRINALNDTSCDIRIYWAASSSERNQWQLSGIFDPETKRINYSGDKIHETYDEDGNLIKTFVYTDGEGSFSLDENSNLYWNDFKENIGERCVFENYALLADTNWYSDYSRFLSENGSAELEIYNQNDVMLCATITVESELVNWFFDLEPDKATMNGDLIYTNDIGVTMVFYHHTHSLSIETTDGLFSGFYYSVPE